jgi:hypothetical protein
MANVFQTLERTSELSGGGKLPEWLSTHPDPGTRIQNTQQRLDTLHRDLSKAVVNRDQYLQHVQSMTYGEDPRQAVLRELAEEIGEGMGLLWRDRRLRAIAGAAANVNFFGLMIFALLVVYLTREHTSRR